MVDVDDKPQTLGDLARELAEANVNIELAYTTYGGVAARHRDRRPRERSRGHRVVAF